MQTESGLSKRPNTAAARPVRASRLVLLGLYLALESQLILNGLAAENQELSPQAREQIQILQAEKAARTQAQRKLDSRLNHALRERRFGTVAPGLNSLKAEVRVGPDDRLLVDIRANVTPGLLAFIEQNGGQVVNSFVRDRAIRARLPLGMIERLAARPDIRSLRPADEAITNVGPINSGGDIAHRADQVRNVYSVDGAGVKIGVLSDSVDHLAQSQAGGELPAVTILPGQAGAGSGEGTAMLEIIHDLSPGAPLYFATAFSGVASFAQNIRDLHAAGCRIIVDDVIYFVESPLQDGPISQAVNDVSAAGTLFFSSAGNGGSKLKGTSGTWEGDFKDGGPAIFGGAARLHDFGGVTYNTVLPGGGFTRLDLFWADPLGASTNDYDVYVLNSLDQVVRISNNVQDGDDDPYESLPFLGVGERVVIVKNSGSADRFLSLMTLRGRLAISTPGSVRGHNASGASNAFSVAAQRVSVPPAPFDTFSSNEVELFSSDGPRRMFFNPDGSAMTPGNYSATGGVVFEKPDITAADGVATSVPGFGNFLGTSAAAPHAGAIAALLWSHKPLLSPAEVRAFLALPALDIEAPGVDANSGAGIVMADQVFDPTPRLVLRAVQLEDANGNGGMDANECVNLIVTLENVPIPNTQVVTGITAVLTSSTPGVTVDPLQRSFPDLSPGTNGTNLVAFRISTSQLFDCGTNAHFLLQVSTSNQISFNFPFQLQPPVSGIGSPVTYAATSVPVAIPDLGTAESGVLVTNFNLLLERVRVAVHLTHTFDYDLRLSLISPDGTEVLLSGANGGDGQNYGASCHMMTVFSDDAATSITDGTAPFLGTFKPQQPLTAFNGKSGAVVNGIWKLRAQDQASADSGILQCWSLELSPLACADGGGQCLIAPIIVQGPTNQIAIEGATVQFAVHSQGTPPLAYQWFFTPTNLAANTLAVATNDTLTISNVTVANAGNYSVLVSNPYGQQISSPASLTVLPQPLIMCGTNRTVQLGTVWDFDSPQTIGEGITVTVLTTVTNADCGDGYIATRTWWASRTNGTQQSCSQTINVLDNRPPVIVCVPDKVVPVGVNWKFDVPTATAAGVVTSVVYDNSLNDLLYRFDPGTSEVGDEIILNGPAEQIRQFAFEFWGIGSANGEFVGDVEARVRFYKNDAPLSASGYASPGTVLFDSGQFPIPATPRAVVLFEDFQIDAVVPLTVPLPGSFTWTVQFSGLAAGDSAGLDLFSPPTVGNNYTDYWERESGVWVLKTNAVGSMDFAARFEALSRRVTLTVLSTVTNPPIAVADGYGVNAGGDLNVSAPGVLANDTGFNGGALTAVLESNVLHGTLVLNGNGSFVYTPQVEFRGTDSFSYRVSSGGISSDPVTVALSVLQADTTPPFITRVTAISANTVRVLFSEPVATVGAETIGNYSINNGAAIASAVLGAEGRTVILTTSNALAGDYVLSVSNVTDQASPPNPIVANSQAMFSFISPRVTTGLVVLYGFNEGAGSTVHDISGVGAALDLNFVNPSGIRWSGNGASGVQFTNNGSAIQSPGAASKVHTALTNSNRATLEAWLTPAGPAQEGPARIVTVSAGTTASDVNLHLGQDFGSASYRLRTTDNSFSWLQAENVFTNTSVACHVVVTYDGEFKRLYVDGVEHSTNEFLLGDFSNWNAAYPLVLGNEATLDRSWLGSLHLVAVYDRALSLAEVQQNHAAGHNLLLPISNAVPVAVNDSYSLNAGGVLSVSAPGLLANDTDADGDPLTVVLESGALHGVVTLNWDGSFVYTPSNNYTGPDSFSYRALDGLTNSPAAFVSLNVSPNLPTQNSTVITRTWLATDECGNSATCSQTVTLLDTRPPLIVDQPLNQAVIAGQGVLFAVTVMGAAPLSYQWFFNETNLLADATNSSLGLTNVQTASAGLYSAIVSNLFGTATSAVASLTVLLPPLFTQQPVSLVVTQGQSASFTALATGTEPLAYQWFFNGLPVSGATNLLFDVDSAQSTNAGRYATVVTNVAGSATSHVAILFVGLPGILCEVDRTVELGAAWGFDAPLTMGDEITVSILSTVTNAGCGEGSIATRIWLASDTNGLQTTCSQTFTVLDTRAPTIVCAPDKTVPFGTDWTFDAPIGRAAGAATSVVYDNSQNDLLNRFDPGLREVGDEIILNGPVEHVGRFAFEYWGTGPDDGEFAGDVQARLRFYANDGPTVTGHLSPGTVLFDSGQFSIPATPRALLLFEDFQIDAVVPLSAPLPSAFTWTVQFSGLAAGDNAGLDIFSPPAVGDNSAGYWERESGDWVLKTNTIPMDFAARLEALSRGVTVTTLGTVTNAPVANTTSFTRTWRATDECGNSATCSQTVIVVDTRPPTIVDQPQNLTVNVDEDAQFVLSAVGAPPLNYQWFFNETNLLAGATNLSLILTNVQATNSGLYSATATNSFGAVTSTVVTLTVFSVPLIVSQPEDQNVSPGDSASFLVLVAAFPTASYQWFFNATNLLADATNSSLTISNAQSEHAGLFSVVVTNSLGVVTSRLARLTLGVPAFIIVQPQNVRVIPEQTARFTVSAGGTPPLNYQWYFNCSNLLAGAVSDTLELSNVSQAQVGTYCVMVSNAFGAELSLPASLRVVTPPDFFTITRTGTVVTLVFSTLPNQFYTAQFKDIIDAAEWSVLRKGSNQPGTGLPMVLQDPQATGPQRFYRILIQ